MKRYMGVEDVCALSFHEKWDGRENYYDPGYSLAMSSLYKWLGLGLIKGERFPSNNRHGFTWGIPLTEIPKIREFYTNPPDTTDFPKITSSSPNFVTWREYMDENGEPHV